MRLVHLTAGTGSFFCGTCLRDHALVKALRRLGHDALMVPLYLPLVLDDSGSREESPLFFGGINVYLQQKSAFFRHTPRWFDKLLDSPALLRQAGRRAGMTNPRELGEMTLSMIEGEHGHQAKELDKLVAWLVEQKPDVVCLSNSLLIGVARRVREELRVPIICSLQGEDAFLDSLPEPYRERCWQLAQERAADVDRFVAPSRYLQRADAGTPATGARKDCRDLQRHRSRRVRTGSRAARVSDSGLSRADVPRQRLGYTCRSVHQTGAAGAPRAAENWRHADGC